MDSQSSSSSTGHGHGNGGAPASSTSVAGGGGGGGGVTHQLPQRDLSSVLAHIEVLQKQLAEKSAEINEVKMREESARQQVAQLNELNAKLSEAKREAMREDFNNKVRGWIQDLDPKQVPDGIKEEFLSGVEKFVDKGNETGAWKVVCCASAVHQNQVNTIQRLTEEYNALRKTVEGGEFRTEESRKRKEAEPCTTVSPAYGVWEQLEGICSQY